jgi:dTDP-glucose pyrophosphorylase
MKPTLVVMAAGVGSRYGGLKQLEPVGPNGETILHYSLYDAIRAGFAKVVFVIREELRPPFEEVFGRFLANTADVAYAYQRLDSQTGDFPIPQSRQKPWGTAHAVLCASEHISAPFAVINADDFYGRGGFDQIGAFLANGDPDSTLFAMVAYRLRNTLSIHGHVSRGVCECSGSRLRRVVERTRIATAPDGIFHTDASGTYRLTGNELVSLNLWGFQPTLFEYLGEAFQVFLEESAGDPKAEFFLPTVVDSLIQQGEAEVAVLPTEEAWFGVTYPEDRAAVETAIRRKIADGVYPEHLEKL